MTGIRVQHQAAKECGWEGTTEIACEDALVETPSTRKHVRMIRLTPEAQLTWDKAALLGNLLIKVVEFGQVRLG